MKQEFKRLRRLLAQDGLEDFQLAMLLLAWAWIVPHWDFQQLLEALADYVVEAPEVVRAELCRRLLAAGIERGPEDYLRELREEVWRNEDGISAE